MENDFAPRSLGTVTAIAAVLMLNTAPALGQDVSSAAALPVQPGSPPIPPAVTVPSAATTAADEPVPSPPPTIILPKLGAEPNAVEAAVPVAPEPAARPSAAPASRARIAERVARSAPEPARVPTNDSAGTADRGTLARGDVPRSAAAPLAGEANAAPAPARVTPSERGEGGAPSEVLGGLLAAVGIAVAGMAAMIRRRRKPEDDAYDAAEPSSSAEDLARAGYVQPLEPAAELRPAEAAVPVAMASLGTARPRPSVEALAAGPVPLGEDRRALLDAMVAAAPDTANPFTSRKARLRRARLILQRRELRQTDGRPFDWRAYRPTTGVPASAASTERKMPVKV